MPSDNESPLKSFFAEFKLAHPIMKHFLWLNHHYNIEQNLLYWLSRGYREVLDGRLGGQIVII